MTGPTCPPPRSPSKSPWRPGPTPVNQPREHTCFQACTARQGRDSHRGGRVLGAWKRLFLDEQRHEMTRGGLRALRGQGLGRGRKLRHLEGLVVADGTARCLALSKAVCAWTPQRADCSVLTTKVTRGDTCE